MDLAIDRPERVTVLRDVAAAPRLIGTGVALPALRVRQSEVAERIVPHLSVRPATAALYRRALAHPSIQTRHFALDRLEDALDSKRDRLHERFESAAVALSGAALASALADAGIEPRRLDFVVATTCTGYLCPGLAAHLVEEAGLRADVRLADLVGMGCGAAVPALEAACNFVAAHPSAVAAVVSTEICSAAMFSDDTAGIVISNSIFADGAAAVIVAGANSGEARGASAAPAVRAFASVTRPEWRDTLRFRTRDGYLLNVLGKDVPDQAAETIATLAAPLSRAGSGRPAAFDRWIVHPGGARVLDAVEKRLRLPSDALAPARRVLHDHGNMSSPSVLFVLRESVRDRAPRAGERALLTAFGAGFSAHATLLSF